MKLIGSSLRNLAPTIELVEQLTRSGKDEVGVILLETMPGPMGDESNVEKEDDPWEHLTSIGIAPIVLQSL